MLVKNTSGYKTLQEIVAILKCKNQTARNWLEREGIKPIQVPFSHGKKFIYRVDENKLADIKKKIIESRNSKQRKAESVMNAAVAFDLINSALNQGAIRKDKNQQV